MHLFDPARLGLEGAGECWIGGCVDWIKNLILNCRIRQCICYSRLFRRTHEACSLFVSAWTANLCVSAAGVS